MLLARHGPALWSRVVYNHRTPKGGGGGRPTMAQGGGSDASGLDDALQAAKDLVQS